jgi:hypothetical protein
MSINHRRFNMFMPEKALNLSDVNAVLKQMCSKTMPQSMDSCMFYDARLAHSFFDRRLNHRLAYVMPSHYTASRIN